MKSTVGYNIVPQIKNDCHLAYILKKGTMVIFYKETVDEVWEYSSADFAKNLYYVSGIELDRRVTFKHQQEARQDKELSRTASESMNIQPKIRISLATAKILVQGYDFEINELGEIRRLR